MAVALGAGASRAPADYRDHKGRAASPWPGGASRSDRPTAPSHRLGRNLAMGFVTPTCAAEATALSVDLIGTRRPAKVTQPCLYDPDNLRVRG
ncbi:MAG: glycine cleavage T C-terminal barrel domain-containing protein [Pseudomonadota bacterium]